MEEIISEILLGIFLWVIENTGAGLHWLLRGQRMPFKEVIERYFGINLLLSALFYGMMVLIAWSMSSPTL